MVLFGLWFAFRYHGNPLGIGGTWHAVADRRDAGNLIRFVASG
jgi:hypothetical protein